MLTDTRKSPNAKVHGLESGAVEWTKGLYRERFETCAKVTVPHLQNMFESPSISHVLENFRIAAGDSQGSFGGTVFGDGDFYKWMEAAVYSAVTLKNQPLLDTLEEYVQLIGRAQQPDGYISTKQIIGEKQGTASRLGDINDFEVYNFGHLFTSACLYRRLTGKTSFLDIAKKAAGYLKELYRQAEITGKAQTAVCPSHYMGLAELYRTTEEPEYLELLKTAVRLRDRVEHGMDDNQDSHALRDHDKIIGHAVRANYLYAGVSDLCMEEEDPELTVVLHRVWNSLVTQKLYITGGCGALYNGASPYGYFFQHQLVHQAYGYEYQLPNVTAYNETCASIGGVCWAYRMFCMEKKAGYADVLERMVLNVNLAAVSLDGKQFFYENMLRRAKKLPYELIWGQERSEYILSYCCPPNLARMITQLSEYAYVVGRDEIYTLLYGASRARVELENGFRAVLIQDTCYPYDGRILFRFEDVEERGTAGSRIRLNLRIPSWVRRGTVTVNGTATRLCKTQAGSYLPVEIEDPENTEIQVDFLMETRLTCAHSLVEETCGQVAVEKGPLVYCLEGMDVPADTLDDMAIPSDVEFTQEEITIENRRIPALTGTLFKKIRPEGFDREALYQDYHDLGWEPVTARMIPYFAWANRGLEEMRIWMPAVPASYIIQTAEKMAENIEGNIEGNMGEETP